MIETPEYGTSDWTAKESRWAEGREVVTLSADSPDLAGLVEIVRPLRDAAR